MQKLPLRPLRLVGYSTQQLDNAQIEEHNDHVEHKTNTRGLTTSAPLLDTIQQIQPGSPDAAIAEAESEARLLLKRTPGSYLLNQVYGLWVFGSLFLMTVIITRKLSVAEYGVYAVAMAAFNTIAYIVALGLEDATTTYIPRIFAEHGKAAAAAFIRRLLFLRFAILVGSGSIMLFAMPLLAAVIAAIPLSGTAGVAAGLRAPALLSHITPIAVYVLGNGFSSLITAVCASLVSLFSKWAGVPTAFSGSSPSAPCSTPWLSSFGPRICSSYAKSAIPIFNRSNPSCSWAFQHGLPIW